MLPIALLMLFLTNMVSAHEIQSISQYISIKRQNQSGRQEDINARIEVNKKFDVGAQATYLERFSFYEKRAGAFVTWRPDKKIVLEARYLQGNGNDILPEKQTVLSAYYAIREGLTPFFYYRDSRYSLTHVNTGTLGVEIEKIPHLILIPMGTYGSASFHSPAETNSVYSYGVRAIYYQENKWSFGVFAFKGRESSQGIIGKSTLLLDTLSGGATLAYYFGKVKAELIVDHTDYHQLNNQFLTTTLNLTWMF